MPKMVAFVDGSIYARSVCDHAAWIAGRTNSSIEIFHVLGRRETKSTPADLSGSIALGARSALLSQLATLDEERAKLAQTRGRAILDDAKLAVEQAGIADVAVHLRMGDIVEAVQEFEADADMVVIGKRGEGADFARLHPGSTMERVARASGKPVFVVSRAFSPIERIAIAYDGGTSSMKAVDHIARNRLFSGLDLQLLTVGTDNGETRKRLEDATATLHGAGHTVESVLLQGAPEKAIASFVERQKTDLLVMGAYGHSHIRNLIIGSTTTEMLVSCRIPVLLFR